MLMTLRNTQIILQTHTSSGPAVRTRRENTESKQQHANLPPQIPIHIWICAWLRMHCKCLSFPVIKENQATKGGWGGVTLIPSFGRFSMSPLPRVHYHDIMAVITPCHDKVFFSNF